MKISAKMKRVQESRAPVEREVGAMWVVGREKGCLRAISIRFEWGGLGGGLRDGWREDAYLDGSVVRGGPGGGGGGVED
jgi:hypothetical protein